mgnify:CR=1 FL=1
MHKEKIAEAIASALNHLENSTKALADQKESAVGDAVWRAAAETEYALFLFSLSHQDESIASSTKHSSPTKQLEVGPALTSAQDLLEEAKESLGASNLEEAHGKTWDARGYILKAWDLLEKKRRSASKAAAATPPQK